MDIKDILAKHQVVDKPWFVADVNFDLATKRLDISLDFAKGTSLPFKQDGITAEYKTYDTVEKEWRHLNFLSMNVI